MTTTPTDAPEGPRTDGARDLGTLRRSRTDRHIAGVAGGLARHFDIDPIIIRVTLVVLVFFGGAGLLLYAAIWLFVPEEGTDAAAVRLDDRSRAFVLYVAAGLAALALLGDTLGHVHLPWPFVVVAVIALVLLAGRDRIWFPSARGRDQRSLAGPVAGPVPTAPDVAPSTASLAAPAPGVPAPVPPAPSPRRGPILFWFTLALIALGEGILGVVDLAGAPVAGPTYAALPLAVIGAMLVLGAFWGRAGGLLLLGLVAGAVLAGSLAADKWDVSTHSTTVRDTPASSAAVLDHYRFGTGRLVLDLTRVADPQALLGRHLDVTGNVGEIEVIVPQSLAVGVGADIRGPGQIDLFGDGHGGVHVSDAATHGQIQGTLLDLSTELKVGHIEVRSE